MDQLNTNSTEYHESLGVAAPALGWIPAPRYSMRRARVLNLVGAGTGRFLDIGCGPGGLLVDLAQMGWRAEGLESSAFALEVGRLILANNSGIVLHGEPENNWRGKFDCISALEVLEHIDDDAAALRDWAEWLKPGGMAVLAVPAHQWMWNAGDLRAGHFRRYSRKHLIAVVEAAGLRVERCEYYGFPLATIIEFLRFGPPRSALSRLARLFRSKRATSGSDAEDSRTMAQKTAEIGTDRSQFVKYWPLCKTWPYVAMLKVMIALQATPLLGRLGNGLIVVARKR